MATKLQAKDVIERFSQVIPAAGQYAESYLRAVESSIATQELPVHVAREQVSSKMFGGARGSAREALIVMPDGNAHSAFTFFHYGFPMGANLAVGWYVTESGRGSRTLLSAAHAVTAGLIGMSELMGGMDLFDQADLIAIFASVHQFAVMEAIYAIAERVQFDRSRIAGRSSGMFGIG